MDPVLTEAARALATGDPLTALKRVALRDDPPALALCGIAIAQLGDLGRSRELLARAARGFGPREAVARARCAIARAELSLATRDLGPDRRDRALDAAIAALDARGDRGNALHGRLIALRRLLLLGRVELAARARDALDLDGAPPALVAIAELAAAEIAIRRIAPGAARAALGRAQGAARRARIPALAAEVAAAAAALDAPAARLVAAGVARPLALDEVAAVLAEPGVIIDACRRAVRDGARAAALARRPVLFALARELGEAWPRDATRDALIAAAFEVRRANESHRARLRVELGRLRRELRGIAEIRATPGGFALAPRRAHRVAVLVPPIDGHGAALLALLGDGEAWSTSALALALGQGQRTVQRALSELEARGKVWSRGGARARRWLAPPSRGLSTALLLPDAPADRASDAMAQDRDAVPAVPAVPTAPAAPAVPAVPAEIVREYGPFPLGSAPGIAGVSYDGRHVWFATSGRLRALDPDSGEVVRSLDVPADAGTACDGRHLYQIAGGRIHKIDPATGAVLSSIPAPGAGRDSGLAWADGTLWVGQHRDRTIHQIDPRTGAILRTLESSRYVTGVTWVDGELWHGVWEGGDSEVRLIDPDTGAVRTRLAMPRGVAVSGLESDGRDRLFCGGAGTGELRVVRRPRRR